MFYRTLLLFLIYIITNNLNITIIIQNNISIMLLRSMSECRIACQIAKQNIPCCFILAANESKPQK